MRSGFCGGRPRKLGGTFAPHNTPRTCSSDSDGCSDFGSISQGLGFDSPSSEYPEVSGCRRDRTSFPGDLGCAIKSIYWSDCRTIPPFKKKKELLHHIMNNKTNY